MIQILPENLIRQIAAGEVIERPASVIKELTENAIDAGATRIDITIESGGLDLIIIKDNGSGMTHQDAPLAVLRHATSKIKQQEDLFNIHTLGFRGEALPSIASVSRFELITKTEQEAVGIKITLDSEYPNEPEEVATQTGTQITISHLFYNIPARRKFQKSPATEQTHCINTVLRIALAYPKIRFTIKTGTRTLLDIPSCSVQEEDGGTQDTQEKERIIQAIGQKTFGTQAHLYHITHLENDISLNGYIADPEHRASDNRHMYLYVNHRYVRDKLLQRAVLEGYRSLLPHGTYPICVLSLTINPAHIDVNVHPQKFEIRFKDSQRVFLTISQMIAQALKKTPWLSFSGATVQPAQNASMHQTPLPQTQAILEKLHMDYERSNQRTDSPNNQEDKIFEQAPFNQTSQEHTWSYKQPIPSASVASLNTKERIPTDNILIRQGFFGTLKILTQFHLLYILCEKEDELVIIDQHAAHERILFERYLKDWEQGQVKQQHLLFPLTLVSKNSTIALIEEHQDTFKKLGLDISEFGQHTLALTAIPAHLKESRAQALAESLIAELSEDAKKAHQDFVHAMIARLACHSAVRSGDFLNMQEMQALLYQLDEVDCNIRCPHGRPLITRLKTSTIGRFFERG